MRYGPNKRKLTDAEIRRSLRAQTTRPRSMVIVWHHAVRSLAAEYASKLNPQENQ